MIVQNQNRQRVQMDIQERPANSGGQVAVFQPPRLPWHDAIQERFGVDRAGWSVLVDSIFPSARSSTAIALALSYCKARNLDIFKRPVHIVPMWSSAAGRMVETVWPGIAELRTTAFRTQNYAGMEAAEFGPIIEHTFKGTAKRGTNKGESREITLQFPEWCRITVLRDLNGKERRFVGPKVLWEEAYAKWADTEVPNDMWAKRSDGQLEKCAEAAALRRAFPEEIGNELTAEEMAGQRLLDDQAVRDVSPPAPPQTSRPTKPPTPPKPDAVAAAPEDATEPPEPPEPPPGHPALDDGVSYVEEIGMLERGDDLVMDIVNEPQASPPVSPKPTPAAAAAPTPPRPPNPATKPANSQGPSQAAAATAKAKPTTRRRGKTGADESWLLACKMAYEAAETMEALSDAQKQVAAPQTMNVSEEAWEEQKQLALKHLHRITMGERTA